MEKFYTHDPEDNRSNEPNPDVIGRDLVEGAQRFVESARNSLESNVQKSEIAQQYKAIKNIVENGNQKEDINHFLLENPDFGAHERLIAVINVIETEDPTLH